ncbi:ribosomal protein L11 methyltransferase, putative [Pseudooceanicola batsensis HTCC2597]|uniref:Ribosomal protein L11 methyltransferase n=1 Tax=Pseudooceanicola batsensis (strain ATCC BAA-863 / DSM 15984 / KCTC 12145 / HTCC2597) TaxID=252305 RepID=A3TZ03_PSEBH|nr:50S ribosomal protein L11 methyltransferase [Pseudooceanicola batsensis]EAQ02821.1 ribosomal protein L11 methyltransferase, putative [Pseudooceanicola batsensis HTCC2597]
MPTFTALTTLPGKDRAEALGEAMDALTPEPYGVGVFEIEDGSGLWEVGGYFSERPDEAGLALLATLHEARPFAVSELPETDWVAKVRRELAPVRAGRFYLYGSHDAGTVPEDAVPLLIEAAMAFGTGHHGTTRGCLEALDRLADRGVVAGSVADIGCGTAVLAMAAARIWPVTPVASDIDPVAVEVAEANLAANDMAGRVVCIEATGFDHPRIAAGAPYDLIFANILKGPLIDLAPDLARHLAPGGHAILSGLLNDQADEVADAYAAQGLDRAEATRIGDWTTLLLGRAN